MTPLLLPNHTSNYSLEKKFQFAANEVTLLNGLEDKISFNFLRMTLLNGLEDKR